MMENPHVFDNFDLGQELAQSLQEAIAYAQGDKAKGRARVYEIPTPSYQGEDIARLRKKLRLSQAGFALALGVSKRTVDSWEAGRSAPSNASAKLIYTASRLKTRRLCGLFAFWPRRRRSTWPLATPPSRSSPEGEYPRKSWRIFNRDAV
jgi:putative transcriptional regulator